MIQYLIVGALGLISLTTMCLFLLVKEGTKGIKSKPYKTKVELFIPLKNFEKII